MQSLNFLNQDEYRTYNLTIARALKNINAAVFLTDLITRAQYFIREGNNPLVKEEKDYWYYTIEKCEERTVLSRKEQDTAIKKLQKMGLLEKKIFGVPGKRYFYVNEDAVLGLFGLSKKHSSLPQTGKVNCPKGTTYDETLRQTGHIYKEPKEDLRYKKNMSDAAHRLARYLFSSILKINPNHKKPDLEKWAQDVDRMLKIDKRTETDVETLIDWIYGNPFWCKNILSASKLRAKFDQLTIAMKSESMKPKNLSKIDRRTKNIDGTPVDSPAEGLF